MQAEKYLIETTARKHVYKQACGIGNDNDNRDANGRTNDEPLKSRKKRQMKKTDEKK